MISRPGEPSVLCGISVMVRSPTVLAPNARRSSAWRSIGMAAQIQAERILLVREQLHLGPRRRIRQADDRQSAFLAAAEQIRLAQIAVALRAVAVLDGAVDGAEQLRAAGGQRHARRDQAVAGAGLDQRFEHLLVDDAQVELFAELMQAR